MQAKTKGRDWVDIFNAYQNSGLTQSQFCEREGIKFYEFKYHRTKYLKQTAKVSGFIPIQVKGSCVNLIELALPGGVSIKINEHTSIDYVKRLLSILR